MVNVGKYTLHGSYGIDCDLLGFVCSMLGKSEPTIFPQMVGNVVMNPIVESTKKSPQKQIQEWFTCFQGLFILVAL